MKKLVLLFISGTLLSTGVSAKDPLTQLSLNRTALQAQNGPVGKGTAATGSRLISYIHLVHDGVAYINADTFDIHYSGTRGGDLLHIPLKYDNGMALIYNTSTSSWDNKYKYTQTFDANNNITDYLSQQWSTVTSTWVNDQHQIKSYDAANNLTSDITQTWNTVTNSWENDYKSVYTYDANNNRLSEISQNWNTVTSTWDNASKYTYTYNAANKVTQEVDQTWNTATSTWDNYSKYTNTYDANNNQLTRLTQIWNTSTSTWDNNGLTTSMYSVSNQFLTEIRQLWNNSTSSWDNYRKTIHADFVGLNPQTDTVQNWNTSTSTWNNSIRYKYTYNSYGQYLTYISDAWNVGGFWQAINSDFSYRFHYEDYTTDVRSLSSVGGTADVYPVPATDKLNIDLKWDQVQPFTVTLIDLQGRVNRTWQLAAAASYHQVVSVGELPAGTYFLKIDGTKGHVVKQIVVSAK